MIVIVIYSCTCKTFTHFRTHDTSLCTKYISQTAAVEYASFFVSLELNNFPKVTVGFGGQTLNVEVNQY